MLGRLSSAAERVKQRRLEREKKLKGGSLSQREENEQNVSRTAVQEKGSCSRRGSQSSDGGERRPSLSSLVERSRSTSRDKPLSASASTVESQATVEESPRITKPIEQPKGSAQKKKRGKSLADRLRALENEEEDNENTKAVEEDLQQDELLRGITAVDAGLEHEIVNEKSDGNATVKDEADANVTSPCEKRDNSEMTVQDNVDDKRDGGAGAGTKTVDAAAADGRSRSQTFVKKEVQRLERSASNVSIHTSTLGPERELVSPVKDSGSGGKGSDEGTIEGPSPAPLSLASSVPSALRKPESEATLSISVNPLDSEEDDDDSVFSGVSGVSSTFDPRKLANDLRVDEHKKKRLEDGSLEREVQAAIAKDLKNSEKVKDNQLSAQIEPVKAQPTQLPGGEVSVVTKRRQLGCDDGNINEEDVSSLSSFLQASGIGESLGLDVCQAENYPFEVDAGLSAITDTSTSVTDQDHRKEKVVATAERPPGKSSGNGSLLQLHRSVTAYIQAQAEKKKAEEQEKRVNMTVKRSRNSVGGGYIRTSPSRKGQLSSSFENEKRRSGRRKSEPTFASVLVNSDLSAFVPTTEGLQEVFSRASSPLVAEKRARHFSSLPPFAKNELLSTFDRGGWRQVLQKARKRSITPHDLSSSSPQPDRKSLERIREKNRKDAAGSRQKSEKDLVKDLKGTLFHILSTKTGSTASEANATTKEEEHKPNRLQREKEAKSKSDLQLSVPLVVGRDLWEFDDETPVLRVGEGEEGNEEGCLHTVDTRLDERVEVEVVEPVTEKVSVEEEVGENRTQSRNMARSVAVNKSERVVQEDGNRSRQGIKSFKSETQRKLRSSSLKNGDNGAVEEETADQVKGRSPNPKGRKKEYDVISDNSSKRNKRHQSVYSPLEKYAFTSEDETRGALLRILDPRLSAAALSLRPSRERKGRRASALSALTAKTEENNLAVESHGVETNGERGANDKRVTNLDQRRPVNQREHPQDRTSTRRKEQLSNNETKENGVTSNLHNGSLSTKRASSPLSSQKQQQQHGSMPTRVSRMTAKVKQQEADLQPRTASETQNEIWTLRERLREAETHINTLKKELAYEKDERKRMRQELLLEREQGEEKSMRLKKTEGVLRSLADESDALQQKTAKYESLARALPDIIELANEYAANIFAEVDEKMKIHNVRLQKMEAQSRKAKDVTETLVAKKVSAVQRFFQEREEAASIALQELTDEKNQWQAACHCAEQKLEAVKQRETQQTTALQASSVVVRTSAEALQSFGGFTKELSRRLRRLLRELDRDGAKTQRDRESKLEQHDWGKVEEEFGILLMNLEDAAKEQAIYATEAIEAMEEVFGRDEDYVEQERSTVNARRLFESSGSDLSLSAESHVNRRRRGRRSESSPSPSLYRRVQASARRSLEDLKEGGEKAFLHLSTSIARCLELERQLRERAFRARDLNNC